jgi:hypothetical protein
MSAKKHPGGPGPVPPGNRPQGPAGSAPGGSESMPADPSNGSPFQDHDEKRRLGGFEGAGEHPRQQPGALNDGDVHSK